MKRSRILQAGAEALAVGGIVDLDLNQIAATVGLKPSRLRYYCNNREALAKAILVINLIGLGLGPTMVGVLSDYFAPKYGQESLWQALFGIACATPVATFCYWRAAKCLEKQWPHRASPQVEATNA